MLLVGVLFMILSLLGPLQASGASEECDRTHEGELVIESDQVFTISDETFCIGGNITVEANAHLIIRNATLITGTMGWTGLSVNQGAKLDLFNVVVESSRNGLWIDARDNAEVNIQALSLSEGTHAGVSASPDSHITITNSTLSEATVGEGATLKIRGSTVRQLDMVFAGSSAVAIEGLTPAYYDSREFALNQSVSSYLSLQETNVGAWAIEVSGAGNVTIKDSTLARASFSFGSVSGEISGLRPGHYDIWSLKNEGKPNCALNLQLINTNVSESWLIDFTGRTKVCLSNSAIARIRVYNTYAELAFHDLDLGNLEMEDGIGQISFEEVSILEAVRFANTMLTAEGNVSFSPNCYIDEWQNSTILRTYRVSVEDETGAPAAGVPVELKSPSGRCLSVTTDSNGSASVTISFDDSNYSEAWTLTATLDDQNVVCPVGFMSSSPIEIRIPSKCDDTMGVN
jgi:hypothetical protein